MTGDNKIRGGQSNLTRFFTQTGDSPDTSREFPLLELEGKRSVQIGRYWWTTKVERVILLEVSKVFVYQDLHHQMAALDGW